MAYGLCSSYLPSGASMGKLVSAAVLGAIAFSVLLAAALLRSQRPGPIVSLLRFAGLGLGALALALAVGSAMVVIDPGEVGVRHAFGYVDPTPLLPGIRVVPPWSSIERYSTREEQWPPRSDQIEQIAALSSEQMGTTVEVSIRWQIDPQQSPKIFTKIGHEQQIETERHRVEVARLQTEQQRLLNQTLSPEALMKQWIEVLHDMKNSSNLIIFVPTEGGIPLLNVGELRKNLKP